MPDRAVLSGIVFVLRAGIPWRMLPAEMGCGSDSTCWRRLRDWQEAGVWERLRRSLLDRLGEADRIDWSRASLDSASVAAKRGAPGPGRTRRIAAMPRGRPLEAPRCGRPQGMPLAVGLTAANTHDPKVFEELVDTIPPIRRPRGGPRKRPRKLHADKAYDSTRCREALRRRGIKVRIARCGVESKGALGRHRWVVERTLAWLGRYRRLAVRYERRADIHEAFLHRGCSLICLNYLTRL